MKVEEFDLGNSVICDACGKDYTTSDAVGGLMFGSHCRCPECCGEDFFDRVWKYNEAGYIRARAAAGEKFRDFALRMRARNNRVRITSGTGAEILEALKKARRSV